MKNDTAPPWMWRSARVAFGLIAAALALGALALAAGAADPPVAGPLRADLTLGAEEGTVRLAQPWAHTLLRPHALAPTTALTLEVTAALEAGPESASAGFWLQPCGQPGRVIVALDGEGYFAVSPYPTDGHPLPWTWFLHAKPRPEANRLRADLRIDSFTLRINDEIAEARAPVGPVCAWGLYAATEAAGDAQARFSRVRLWAG